jgi:hypothetical protein
MDEVQRIHPLCLLVSVVYPAVLDTVVAILPARILASANISADQK